MYAVCFPEWNSLSGDTLVQPTELHVVVKGLRDSLVRVTSVTRGEGTIPLDVSEFERPQTHAVVFLQLRNSSEVREELGPRLRLNAVEVLAKLSAELLLGNAGSCFDKSVAEAVTLNTWFRKASVESQLLILVREINEFARRKPESIAPSIHRLATSYLGSCLGAPTLLTDLLAFSSVVGMPPSEALPLLSTLDIDLRGLPITARAIREANKDEILSLPKNILEQSLSKWITVGQSLAIQTRISSHQAEKSFSSINSFASTKVVNDIATTFRIAHMGLPIDCSIQIIQGAPLVVMLHGRRSPGVVLPFLSGAGITKDLPVSRLSISDPTLYLNEHCHLSWYVGNSMQPKLQDDLVRIIKHVQKLAGAQSIGLVGGSGGGFASIALSGRIPKSRAFVWNPQTTISRYPAQFYNEYVSTAWPGGEESISANATTSLEDYYTTHPETGNEVLYLQQLSDKHHVDEHFYPMIQKLRGDSRFEFRLKSWGDGHVPPPREIIEDGILWAARLEENPKS